MEQTSLFADPPPAPPTVRRRKRQPTITPDQNRICWQPSGGYHACDHDHEHEMHVFWGRCRSGKRWFWAAIALPLDGDATTAHGWADTEDQALTEARTGVVQLTAGKPAYASMRAGTASGALKRINAEKRKARPASGRTDTGMVEYLYGVSRVWDADARRLKEGIVPFRITKKTAKRIYYVRCEHDGEDPQIGFVDRQEIESKGEAQTSRGWWVPDCHLYAAPPDLDAGRGEREADDVARLAELKQRMADAHPDRGGDAEEFRRLRAEYVRLRDRVRARTKAAA